MPYWKRAAIRPPTHSVLDRRLDNCPLMVAMPRAWKNDTAHSIGLQPKSSAIEGNAAHYGPASNANIRSVSKTSAESNETIGRFKMIFATEKPLFNASE